ncbi:MAG: hypothetical protein V4519_01875 [Patescibacteria group bacterium]
MAQQNNARENNLQNRQKISEQNNSNKASHGNTKTRNEDEELDKRLLEDEFGIEER